MTQHALGCGGKPSDAPSHKYPGKMSRESQHSGDKVVYTGLSPILAGVREVRGGGEEAQTQSNWESRRRDVTVLQFSPPEIFWHPSLSHTQLR